MLKKLIELLRPDVSVDVKLAGITTVVGKELDEIDSRLRTQEIRSFIKGDKGDKGDSGRDGKDGKNGKDGRDGKDGVGKDGKDGKIGNDGKDGKDGVSVVDAEVAVDDHLVFKLSNGNIIDAGELPSAGNRSTQHIISNSLQNEQITVSATAPQSPYVGQLWYDIS